MANSKFKSFLEKCNMLVFAKRVYYSLREFLFKFGVIYRKVFKNNSYSKLKQYKNIHNGKRCFIIATGPSLTISDLELLKNEYTFSMNSIILSFNETKWRPTYYGIQDADVYRKLEKDIQNCNLKDIFVGSSITDKFKIDSRYIKYPLDLMDHCVEFEKFDTKFSDDCYLRVYDGYSITYSLIQIAAYMGFKEIYLLGVDCNYDTSKTHFKEHGVGVTHKESVKKRMTVAYEVAKKYCEGKDLKIFNATRGGMLEVFERVNLEDIVSK